MIMIRFKNEGMTLVVGLLCCLILLSCEGQITLTEKYCGYELTDREVLKVKTQESNSYEYSDKDLDVLADITTEVQSLFDDTLVIEVFFF